MFGTGALPSKIDPRDVKDTSLTLSYPYPSEYETFIDMLEVEDQEKIGICTSYLKTYIEYLYFKKTGKYVRLSAAFLYIITKLYIDKNMQEGSQLRSALKAAQKYGVCTEATFPTNVNMTHAQFLSQSIPKEAWNEALNYRIGGYINIPIEKSLLAAAIHKYGMLYARMEVGSSWWTPSWHWKDILPLRKPSSVVSGHAVNHHGYEISDKTKIRGRNSWGKEWALMGNFYYFMEDYMPTEAWAITLESVMPMVDNTPLISDSMWRKLIAIFRDLKIIK